MNDALTLFEAFVAGFAGGSLHFLITAAWLTSRLERSRRE
ncbi:hypothetical protein CIP101434_01973 [Corynebacterium diphtheriae]|nr:hypothetical protein CIP101280_01780 [Corynebacterium diphtheriae]CAB0524031.1 hypothetical protein CIP101434_01973 [Corynebacterium diphtheriae]CAB0870101.1 hypothetical protein FRC0370_01717 [Corynebacterium diphtheriae]CAB0884048.1 hypothetical protein FRC0405_01829 [Corynebacterium diphtheriae]CAB0963863.1 hypothetical protein FRC0463_01714 [Corynebacterium diphtheriae]